MGYTMKIYQVTLKNKFVPSMQPWIFYQKIILSFLFILCRSLPNSGYSMVSLYLNIETLK